MFLLNLSVLEFLAIFSALSAFVVTLYLLSRSRRRQRVATLRFWTQAQAPVVSKQRRRIQQPFSLLLQLLSIALLLLALGQLQWGTREESARDHVLLLDTSSWMSARSGANRSLLDEAKDKARAYVHALPASDRVMVVRADALSSPATGMDNDRRSIEKPSMIRVPARQRSICSRHSHSPSKFDAFTRDARAMSFTSGLGRVAEQGMPVQTPMGLRVIPVGTGAVDNVGLTRIGLRRSPVDPRCGMFLFPRGTTEQASATFHLWFNLAARRSRIDC